MPVLCVEDDPSQLVALATVLNKSGIPTLVATDVRFKKSARAQ